MQKSLSAQERIAKILDHFNLTAKKLAASAGLHFNTLYSIQNGQTKEITGNVAQKILKTLPRLNPNFLYVGAGDIEKLVNDSEAYIVELEEKIKDREKRINDLETIIGLMKAQVQPQPVVQTKQILADFEEHLRELMVMTGKATGELDDRLKKVEQTVKKKEHA